MKNTPAIVTVTLSLLLSACGTLTTPPASQADQPEAAAARPQPGPQIATAAQLRRALQAGHAAGSEPLPAVELSADILYKLLSAEVAAQRGDWKTAYVNNMSMAQQTRDPRLARRAMEIALTARKHDEALAAVRLWRTLAPSSDQATQYFLGFVMLSNSLAEARPLLAQRLQEASPETRVPLMSQVQQLLARAKDKAAGFALLDQLLAPYADAAETRMILAQGALAAGNPARARREALAAQAASPDSERAALTMALVAPDKDMAINGLVEFLARHPGARDVRVALARLLVEQKQYIKAREQFEQLLQAKPDDLPTLYALGVLSAQTRDNDAAEKYLGTYVEQMAAQDGDEGASANAMLLLSQLAEERKDTASALKWLAQIDRGEAWLGAQIRRAQLMAKDGDLAGARKLLKALAPAGEREQVQLLLTESQLLRDAGQLQEAITVLDGGLVRYPANTDLLYDQALLADSADQLALAEKNLRKIITLAPKNQHAYNALGYTLANRNMRLQEAQQLIRKALELAPEDPYIMDSMGWAQFRLGRLREAEDYLRRAFALRPDAEIAAHLGEVLWAKGDREAAQAFWRDALAKDPRNETLKSTVQRLQGAP